MPQKMRATRPRNRTSKGKIPKANRRSLRLWAEGAREQILTPHIESYADALERGWRAERDYLQSVCNEFHARISWRLKDHEEPELPLPEYSAEEMLDDTDEGEEMDDDEQVTKRERINGLNLRIRRWLKYRARRLRKLLRTKLDPLKDPWAILLAKLSGVTSPPKARQAYQQFMREEFQDKIAPVAEQRWIAETTAGGLQTKKTPDGPFRARVAREMFAALPEEDQKAYGARAKEEAGAARKAYDSAIKMGPSKSPEDKKKCIDEVGKFVGPILQGIFERTGFHSTLIMGGPMPQFGGELQTVYVSYGRNKTGKGEHFSQWGGERFNAVLDLMREYLHTAFSEQDQSEAALTTTLDGAKYTIPPDMRGLNDDDDDDDEEEWEEDDEEEEDDEDEEEDDAAAHDSNADSDDSQPVRKRKRTTESEKAPPKTKAKAKPKAAVWTPMTLGEETYGRGGLEAFRSANIARNKILLAPLMEDVDLPKSSKAVKKTTAKKDSASGSKRVRERAAAAPRKSQRLTANSTAGSSMANDTVERNAAIDTLTTAPITPVDTLTAGSSAVSNTLVEPNAPTAPITPVDTLTAGSSAITNTAVEPNVPTAPTTPLTLVPPVAPVVPVVSVSASIMPTTAEPPPTESPTSTASPIVPASSIELTFPEDTPPWLRDAVGHLQEPDLGCHYKALLVALIRLEESAGYESTTSLPVSKLRPAEVKKWIRGARGAKLKELPTTSKPAAYADSFNAWWDSLQPLWRERNTDGTWKVGGKCGKEWGGLDCAGVNGTISIVGALHFWGTSAAHTEETRAVWETAVLDVAWMLESMDAALFTNRDYGTWKEFARRSRAAGQNALQKTMVIHEKIKLEASGLWAGTSALRGKRGAGQACDGIGVEIGKKDEEIPGRCLRGVNNGKGGAGAVVGNGRGRGTPGGRARNSAEGAVMYVGTGSTDLAMTGMLRSEREVKGREYGREERKRERARTGRGGDVCELSRLFPWMRGGKQMQITVPMGH
ncbi:hypothetical protein C8R43DRAFT_963850 [Mycena crocata]|nr:hypothetical protein C8R43DRAFT_963850 [Mycena crocata]